MNIFFYKLFEDTEPVNDHDLMSQIAALTTKLKLLKKAREIDVSEEERQSKQSPTVEVDQNDERQKQDEFELQKDESNRQRLIMNLSDDPNFGSVRDLLANFGGKFFCCFYFSKYCFLFLILRPPYVT